MFRLPYAGTLRELGMATRFCACMCMTRWGEIILAELLGNFPAKLPRVMLHIA